MADDVVRIGLLGFGTVGAGVAKILLEDADAIRAKTGVKLELACVVDLDTTSERPVKLPAGMLTDDINTLLEDDSIQIGVELIGGTTVARDMHLKMLGAGKHVITANKALLAEHGNELYAAAGKAKRCIAFEASCVGGVPIISALRTGLAANRISAMYGIMNGTCNYILSNMTRHGSDFQSVLNKAQEKGYAEADPTLDINGGDTAHKLAILARLAFGCEIDYDDLFIEGIEHTSIDDINYGKEMGYVLKLLAIGEKDGEGRISLRVHPSFVSKDSMLGRVEGSFNAVSVFGHAVGETIYFGRGAGMMPTASAVVADIIEVAMGNSQKLFDCQTVGPAVMNPIENITSRFYLRLMVKDEPGVVAQYSKILGDHGISIAGVLQHEKPGPDGTVPVVVTTHETLQGNMAAALKEMESLQVAGGKPICIHIVDIPEDAIDD